VIDRRQGTQADQRCGSLRDVDDDGEKDLLSSLRASATGIALGDTTACLRGAFRDGRSFGGCDAILTTAESDEDHER
jgi:hypothetical protein